MRVKYETYIATMNTIGKWSCHSVSRAARSWTRSAKRLTRSLSNAASSITCSATWGIVEKPDRLPPDGLI